MKNDSLLIYILEQIRLRNPLHGKKIAKNFKNFDSSHEAKSNELLEKYISLVNKDGNTIDYLIDCYLNMIADFNYEGVQFQQTGEYSSKSFKEVNARVYNNPEIMNYHMHGLLISQFLWKHHYDILLYYNELIAQNTNHINHYLEVGGGHGLYISEAIKILDRQTNFDLVDISSYSLDIAKGMIRNEKVNFFLTDIFNYSTNKKYDFISMGEVLEHVEDPVNLLVKIKSLLNDSGKLFITTPTNAPAIDHIYLFKCAKEIRNVIEKAGFRIEKEKCIYTEDVPAEVAEKYKISMMFAGLLTKKS